MEMVLTGTAAYGPFTDDSDIDIAIIYYEAEGLVVALKSLGIQVRSHKHVNPIYQGVWFEACGRIIQFIVLNTKNELKAWRLATEDMMKLKSFEDRQRRVKVFQRYYQKHLAQMDDQPSSPTIVTDNKPTYDHNQDDVPSFNKHYTSLLDNDDDIPF